MANPQIDADLVLRLKNLDKILNEIKTKVGAIQLPDFKFSAQSAQAYTQFIRAMGQSGPQFQAAANNINKFTASIAGSTAALNRAAPGLKALSSVLNAVNNSSRASSKSLLSNTTAMEDLGRQTAITIRRFGGFLIASRAIYGITSAFTNAISEGIKFERELIKIAQLQNTSIAGAKELGKFIGNLAVQFGASASELAQSAQVLAQAGKQTGEIRTILKALGEASLTPTFGDLAKTTDSLLAVLGQFNLTGADAAQTLDVLNSVAKDFNVSVDELFEGVRRAGSTFSELSGVKDGVKPGIDSLKEFVALFTSVIDTSRESAESIGTAFRTILPRLLRGKTRDLLKKELGLDLLDDEQQFIGPYKAIEKLFSSLSKFKGTDVTLTKVVEELGGSRQFGRVLPLILEFPKAQRALEIANRASGSVAKDSELAYAAFSVQLQKVREELLQIGRDLVQSGTFKVYADAFLAMAKGASALARALEPLIPLIAALSTLALAKSTISFGRGALFDNAYRMAPVRKASGGNINKVQSLLTPGELIIGPESAKMNGQAALRRFNSTGDIGALKTLKGASLVPGTGNSDSVPANLEPGSFVIRKHSVQKALGFKRFASGGRVGMAQGDFALSPSLGDLDTATVASLTKYGRELKFLGENTKSINNLFKSILSSSRDLPTALSRIAAEVSRSYPASNPNLPGGGVKGNSLNIPLALAQIPSALKKISNQKLLPPPVKDRRYYPEFQPQNSIIYGMGPLADPIKDLKQALTLTAKIQQYPSIFNNQKLLGYDPSVTPYGTLPLSGPLSPIANLRKALEGSQSLPQYPSVFKPSQLRLGYDPSVTPYGTIPLRGPISDPVMALRAALSSAQPVPQYPSVFKPQQLLLGYDPTVTPHGTIPLGAPPRQPNGVTALAQALAQAPRQYGLDSQIASGMGITAFGNVSNNPYATKPSKYGSTLSDRAAVRLQGAYIQTRRALLRAQRFSPTGAFNRLRGAEFSPTGIGLASTAGLGATIAGSTISANSTTSGGSVLGGALQGAGIGATLGLGSMNPYITALAALTGAVSGAALSFNSFNKNLKNSEFSKLTTEFISGRGDSSRLGRNLASRQPNLNPGLLDYLMPGRLYGQIQGGGFRRNLEDQSQKVREEFQPSAEFLVNKIEQDVQERIKKGSFNNANDIQKVINNVTPDDLRLLATSDPRFQVNDTDSSRLALGRSVFDDLIRELIKSSKTYNEVNSALQRLTRSSISLDNMFNQIDAGLRSTEVALNNVGNRIGRIIDPANLVNDEQLNVFGNMAGFSPQRIQQEVQKLEGTFGLGRTVTGDAAILTSQLINELPAALANAQANNPAMTVEEALNEYLGTKGGTAAPILRALENFAQTFGEKTLNEVDVKDVAKSAAEEMAAPIKIMERLFSQRERKDAVRSDILNQRNTIFGGVQDQSLAINNLRNQGAANFRMMMGDTTANVNRARSQVGQDLMMLGAPPSPAAILDEINKLRQGGIKPEEAAQYNSLIKALQLLGSDTRVLDETMKKYNEHQQAQQGTKTILERILGGPDAISSLNQEVKDFQTIAQGGDIGGPRALAALRTAQQIQESLNPQQIEQLFGISQDQFSQSLNNVLGAQGTSRIGGDSRNYAAALLSNLQPPTDIAQQAQAATQTQVQALEALRSLDEQRITDLNGLLSTQSAEFSAKIREAFESDSVKAFNEGLASIAGGINFTHAGKIDVVVAFNGVKGAFLEGQSALEPFIRGVVNDQVNKALNNSIPKANTA